MIAPKADTRLTKYPKTIEHTISKSLLTPKHSPFPVPLFTFKKTRAQNAVHKINEIHGTPYRLTLLNKRGACPWIARPYSVLVPVYRSELAALNTKMRIQALTTCRRDLMPTSVHAVIHVSYER